MHPNDTSLASFDSLPVELVSAILVETLHITRSDRIIKLTLSILLVSHRFFNTAIATSPFWSRIVIPSYAYSKRRISTWLDRSRDHPLDLEIFFSEWNCLHDMEFEVGNERMELLLPHAHRWRSLCLQTGDMRDMNKAMALLPRELPSLYELRLLSNGHAPWLTIGNNLYPSLRRFVVSGVSVDWSGFLDLVGSTTPPSEGISSTLTLPHSPFPRLESFELNGVRFALPEHARPKTNSIITLPNLSTLRLIRLNDCGNPPLRTFLTSMFAPALTHLHLEGPFFSLDWGEGAPEIRLPLLEKLSVFRIRDMDRIISDVLKYSPNLVGLELGRGENIPTLLCLENDSFCPQLSEMTTTGIPVAVLLRITQARHGKLQSVTIHPADTEVDPTCTPGELQRTLEQLSASTRLQRHPHFATAGSARLSDGRLRI